MPDQDDELPEGWPVPTRTEPRGDFPDHDDRPGRRVLSAAEARRRARERLEKWRRENE